MADDEKQELNITFNQETALLVIAEQLAEINARLERSNRILGHLADDELEDDVEHTAQRMEDLHEGIYERLTSLTDDMEMGPR
jgi:hypothetical protein